MPGLADVASERFRSRRAPPHPRRTVVDAPELGDLQIERGTEFRQVGRLTSQIIELRELAVMRSAGCNRGFDLLGQCLHL